jgi:arsenate reductase-like glutaredoxin family protein
MEPLKEPMSEAEIVAKYSTSGLQKHELDRFAKKMNMEFDAQCNHMTKEERKEFLDQHFPETTDEPTTPAISTREVPGGLCG